MSAPAPIDWDDAYANAAHIRGAQDYPPRWAAEAAAFRDAHARKSLDVPYGTGPRQCLDLFSPAGTPKGLVVFVHGGYWLRFDKSYWSHFAAGALAHGWAVCLPSYDLAPQVRIAEITRQIGAAVTGAAEQVGGPIRLAGHSAGGHLVTRMVCQQSPLPSAVLARIVRTVSISGLHDLRPLLKTRMNESFSMSEADAIAESPALMAPTPGARVTAWVGAGERPEFIRQARLLAEAWPGAEFYLDPDKHHFDVIDGLRDKASGLTAKLLESDPASA